MNVKAIIAEKMRDFMKKTIILCALLTMIFSASALAQQPKTVTDYFLALPNDKYSTDIEGKKITGKANLAKFRRSMIKIEDVKNGYLKLEGPWEGWAEIALFKKKDGSYLIAHAESGCGPVCDGLIKFYTYKAGKWTDVTKQVFPNLTEAQIKKAFTDKKIDTEENGLDSYYLLPQEGTTVKLACNQCSEEANDFVLMEFVWNGEKFTVKK